MRILVIEDERRPCNIIKRGLLEEGYAVDTTYDGEDGEYLAGLPRKGYRKDSPRRRPNSSRYRPLWLI